MVSWNIAVREFTSTSSERKSARASELAIAWMREICVEFGIDLQRDILTSSSDSGPDIKRALDIVFPTMREWRVSHLIHLALAEAFGTNLDRSKSRNSAARDVSDSVRSITEKVNKSGQLKTMFDELTTVEFGAFRKLKNAPMHWWSASELVLERVLQLWSPLVAAFAETSDDFSLRDDRAVLIEFYSVLWACRYIQVQAQKMKEFVSTAVYINLVFLWFAVLDSSQPLEIVDPTTKSETLTPAARLDLRTTEVRAMLRRTFATRYFDRYYPRRALKWPAAFYGEDPIVKSAPDIETDDLRFSYVFDMQAILYPQLSNGDLVKKLVFASDLRLDECPPGWTPERLKVAHYRLIMAFVWKVITRLAVRVAHRRSRPSGDGSAAYESEVQTRESKR